MGNKFNVLVTYCYKFAIMYFACSVSVASIRKTSNHQSEMISQLIFGECCTQISEVENNFMKIKCAFDQYEGWVQVSQIQAIDEISYKMEPSSLTPSWASQLLYNGHLMQVPLGSVLTSMRNGHAWWLRSRVKYTGKVWYIEENELNKVNFKNASFQFLNTPYLWGGKSVFGIDCSGYVQQVFRLFGKTLPRDAHDQAYIGDDVLTRKESQMGDLAFFKNGDGYIYHVGIILNKDEIIHAAGKVRIDKFTNDGIVNVDTNVVTHSMSHMKRIAEIV